MASRGRSRHLLRRATFGPRAEEVDAAESAPAGRHAHDRRRARSAPPTPDAGAARTPPPAPPDPVAALGKDADRERGTQAAQKQQREQVTALTVWWLDRMVAADHQPHEKLIFFWHGHWATSVAEGAAPPG